MDEDSSSLQAMASAPLLGRAVCAHCSDEIVDKYLLKVKIHFSRRFGDLTFCYDFFPPCVAAGERPVLACAVPLLQRVSHLAQQPHKLLHQGKRSVLQIGLLSVRTNNAFHTIGRRVFPKQKCLEMA